ncbi:hypothetical protein [Noviherbaspirillum sp.]|uniref:hypothetical protein n=1 Tax=Noviherbaspirillum sp. TaxID=1926288 RepID=UPI002B492504|nr:hypothetical protein [Noviherbaspirillum sp.]HJV83597.1 hypothetical protein [Noviherbaspirillum sp.]
MTRDEDGVIGREALFGAGLLPVSVAGGGIVAPASTRHWLAIGLHALQRKMAWVAVHLLLVSGPPAP